MGLGERAKPSNSCLFGYDHPHPPALWPTLAMDALASAERASQWTPAPTPSTAAHPDGLRATGTSTQKSEHDSRSAIRAATTLSVGPTSWDAVRERQVFHQKVPHFHRPDPVSDGSQW